MELYQSKHTGEEMEAVFDKVSSAKVTTGKIALVAADSGQLKTIDLGFEPDMVICYQVQNNGPAIAGTYSGGSDTTGYNYQIPRIITKAYSSNSSKITSSGFGFVTNNSNSIDVYYIAIKF